MRGWLSHLPGQNTFRFERKGPPDYGQISIAYPLYGL
jgi:hypothetical protein